MRSGSDLTTLTPRQVLGDFIGARGRHRWDTDKVAEARKDFDLALSLYPQSRVYKHMIQQCNLYDRIKGNLFTSTGAMPGDGAPSVDYADLASRVPADAGFGSGYTN